MKNFNLSSFNFQNEEFQSQISKWNKEIKLGALYPTRDFNYVDDCVDAFLLAGASNKAN